jgi:hypothetical protein
MTRRLWIMNWKGHVRKIAIMALFEVLSWNLTGNAKDNSE